MELPRVPYELNSLLRKVTLLSDALEFVDNIGNDLVLEKFIAAAYWWLLRLLRSFHSAKLIAQFYHQYNVEISIQAPWCVSVIQYWSECVSFLEHFQYEGLQLLCLVLLRRSCRLLPSMEPIWVFLTISFGLHRTVSKHITASQDCDLVRRGRFCPIWSSSSSKWCHGLATSPSMAHRARCCLDSLRIFAT